jgi:hypothetical protein
MPLDIPNGSANPFIPRIKHPAPIPEYASRLSSTDAIAYNIELYADLHTEALVSTPMVPIPSKARGAKASFGFDYTVGDTAGLDEAPPVILEGF